MTASVDVRFPFARKHRLIHCGSKCRNVEGYCPYCDGGLSACAVCGGAEGSLLKYCPGYRLTEEALDSIYQGNVVDFSLILHLRKNLPPELYADALRRANHLPQQ